ncbi:MAG TPA: hypothetical protein P5565_12250, partial [Bacteroidia bacterium]|nr:hypothetical protein [Bacteroidia bacterium]
MKRTMKNRFRYLLAALLLPGFVAAQSLEEARKLTENEQYDAATNVYQQLISREPANGNLYYFFGDNYLLGDNADSAMIVFEQGRKADAANLLLSIGMAKSLMDRMSVREAKSAAEKDPSNAEAAARSDMDRRDVLIHQPEAPERTTGNHAIRWLRVVIASGDDAALAHVADAAGEERAVPAVRSQVQRIAAK